MPKKYNSLFSPPKIIFSRQNYNQSHHNRYTFRAIPEVQLSSMTRKMKIIVMCWRYNLNSIWSLGFSINYQVVHTNYLSRYSIIVSRGSFQYPIVLDLIFYTHFPPISMFVILDPWGPISITVTF